VLAACGALFLVGVRLVCDECAQDVRRNGDPAAAG
jgi:hypothetical protein